MGDAILYLDSRQSRAVMKALRKHGTVDHARDISQALLLMAENDFDYFFVDADTPQAQAFLKHLQHDPTLPPPSGVVLLTDNDEEDCRAWSVDTFINRGRVYRDAPYVFSHQKVESHDDSNVLRITGNADARRAVASEESKGARDVTQPGAEALVDEAFNLRKRSARSGETKYSYSGGANRAYRYVLAAALILALGLWLFAWGPFARNKGQDRRRAASNEVEAGSKSKQREPNPLALFSVPAGYAGSTAPALRSSAPTGAVGPTAATEKPAAAAQPAYTEQPASTGQPAVAEKPAAAPAPSSSSGETAAAPQPAPAANRPPMVEISGPTRLTARQAATYTASGSDPDGDGITYSWGGSTTTRCWSTPGLYSLTVTVTDGRGETASASLSVRVI